MNRRLGNLETDLPKDYELILETWEFPIRRGTCKLQSPDSKIFNYHSWEWNFSCGISCLAVGGIGETPPVPLRPHSLSHLTKTPKWPPPDSLFLASDFCYSCSWSLLTLEWSFQQMGSLILLRLCNLLLEKAASKWLNYWGNGWFENPWTGLEQYGLFSLPSLWCCWFICSSLDLEVWMFWSISWVSSWSHFKYEPTERVVEWFVLVFGFVIVMMFIGFVLQFMCSL